MANTNTYLKFRFLLTILWLLFFTVSLIMCESYIHSLNNGKVYITESERLLFFQPLSTLYSPYLIGILGFWFVSPFQQANTDKAAKYRFVIALTVTCVFNLIILLIIAQPYITPENTSDVIDTVNSAIKIAGWLSIIVAPINAYYFGQKSS